MAPHAQPQSKPTRQPDGTNECQDDSSSSDAQGRCQRPGVGDDRSARTSVKALPPAMQRSEGFQQPCSIYLPVLEGRPMPARQRPARRGIAGWALGARPLKSPGDVFDGEQRCSKHQLVPLACRIARLAAVPGLPVRSSGQLTPSPSISSGSSLSDSDVISRVLRTLSERVIHLVDCASTPSRPRAPAASTSFLRHCLVALKYQN